MVKSGDTIVFKGYSDEVDEAEQYLTEGEEYVIKEVKEVNDDDKSVSVLMANPRFDDSKKPSAKNPSDVELVLFDEEFEVKKSKKAAAKPAAKAETKPAAKGKAKAAPVEDDAEDEGEEADDADDAEEVEEAPAPKAKGKPAKTEAKPAAKGKAAAKTKGKAPAKAKAKPAKEEVEEDADPYADLDEDSEDGNILGMVNDAEDILELAKEIVEEESAVAFKLGGVLFHVRKSGAYKELDDRYSEKGGFNLYVMEQLNVEYRKAMYLIDIYYKTCKYGLDAERISAIGWAKAAKIAAVMTEDTAEELLELAEGNTVTDLVENIKANYKEVGGEKGEKKKKLVTFKFRLFEDQGTAVTEVIEATAAALGYKKLDDAFEHIVMEWAAEHPVSKPKAKTTAPAKAKADAPAKGKATAKAGK